MKFVDGASNAAGTEGSDIDEAKSALSRRRNAARVDACAEVMRGRSPPEGAGLEPAGRSPRDLAYVTGFSRHGADSRWRHAMALVTATARARCRRRYGSNSPR